ncbi:hypothetical protein [Micromonospora sp. HK10]|uniref:hypothetical protein n=1 Tax=Micromonospora TaxID=1873 RepID=UPI000B021BEA|nr:hypothetical protein [Micromonospora sp. HK10]
MEFSPRQTGFDLSFTLDKIAMHPVDNFSVCGRRQVEGAIRAVTRQAAKVMMS